MSIVGYLIGKVKNRKIGIVKSVKIAIFSSTILIVLEVALSRLIDIGLFSFVIYAILFLICLFASGDKEMKFKEKEKPDFIEE
jgi:hypothetical protein